MTEYIAEIQRQLIANYGFEPGPNGCPKDVPDGAYPMLIKKELDLVVGAGGKIWCCNFITSDPGLEAFQKVARQKYLKP